MKYAGNDVRAGHALRRFVVAALFAFLLPALPAAAHDIPNDVTVQAFIKPEGQKLQVLMRVPMKALRDIVFPETPGGFLDIGKTPALLPDAATLWVSDAMDLYEGDTLLPKPKVAKVFVSLESDRSFSSYEEAMAHINGPALPPDLTVVWNQVAMDVLFEYPIQSAQSRFSIRPSLGRLGLRVVTVLRYVTPNGSVRALEYTGDPGLVRLDPQWYQAAGRFIHLGFDHILDGTDHLLFLFCLVIPFRRFRALVPIITAFTVAHSITMIASAFHFAPDALWFPPLIEMLIALSIVYMALENIVGETTVHHRWMIAFGFGLVHGFGFSFALRETLQFAGSHLLASLFSFNLGVELGQLLVLSLLVPALWLLFRYVVKERMGVIILSAFVAHTGWHWMMDRWDILSKFHFSWPAMTPDNLLLIVRWLLAAVVISAVLWAISTFTGKGSRTDTPAADRAD